MSKYMKEKRSEFRDYFDRLMAARAICAEIEEKAGDALVLAKAVLVLLQFKKLSAPGATIRDIEIGILRVSADQGLVKRCLETAENKALECARLLSQLELCESIGDAEDLTACEKEYSSELWHLTASIEEIRGLKDQAESGVVALTELPPI